MTRRLPRWRRGVDRLIEVSLSLPGVVALQDLAARTPVQVRHQRMVVPRGLGGAPQLRVAFASDFHAGPLTPSRTLEQAFDRLMAAEPDLILLGGDYVCTRSSQVRRLREPLRRLSAPLGVVAVLGNHDHEAGAAEITAELECCGVTVLVNRGLRLPPPFAGTLLLGLDDHLAGTPRSERLPWDPSLTTVLLLHQPSGLLDTGPRRFDLALAGHTHGGQITLPGGYAPVVASGALSRRYLRGRFQLPDGGELLVSVGVGNTLLPLRVGPRPEVIVCDLVPPSPSGQAPPSIAVGVRTASMRA